MTHTNTYIQRMIQTYVWCKHESLCACRHVCMYICMHVCLNLESSYCYCKIKDKINCDFRRNESFQPRCWCQLQMRIYVCIFFYFLCIYVLRIYFYISTFILHVTSSQFCLHLFIFATSIIYVHMHIYTRTHTRTHVWLALTRRTASQVQELCWQGRK